MLKQKINRAFTLIEILVVIIIIIIFVFIAWPNITNWQLIVSKERSYILVEYLEEKKAEVKLANIAVLLFWSCSPSI